MNMNDWLKKWYNDQFEKIDVSPSSEVWENISESLDEWPKHWYSSNTNQLKTAPRPSTWESLQSELANINYPLRSARPAYALIAMAILVLILVPVSLSDGSLSLTNVNDTALVEHETASLNDDINYISNKKTNQSANLSIKESSSSTKEETSKNINRSPINEEVAKIESKVDTLIPHPLLTNTNQSKKNKLEVDHILKDNSELASLKPKLVGYESSFSREELVDFPKDVSTPNYSIGFHLTPQFSTLLNPLRSKSKTSGDAEIMNPASIGFDLSFEKHITSKNSLRLNVRGNNLKSLKIKENNTTKKMTLNYASLDLTYSRKWRIGNSDKLLLKTNIGLFAGYAISKDVNYDGERVSYISDGLRNMDFGNSLGIVLSRKLSNNLRLEVGAISQFGVINIFKGTNVLPSKYFRTSTTSYGLSLGLIKEF